ncbi:molybdopterin-synthase adenylyltransferase MoeB [Aquimarina sp. W85]|uniref:molybdopterin-synthase adenylyltransferase MoeB n=1 Tax=Aquimarina rhodophyticola TaxID=3342246 RepID=UPI00336E80BE|nr:HesA/MoeB/ThiF family protein [Tritonibacter mobilis]
MLTQNEQKQYNRHLILEEIGLEGQEKLKNSKVLMIGAGGLGCPVLQYLTSAGVGTIGIIDDDKVDQSNLQRQVLYTVDDIGKPKVHMASQKLSKLNPHVRFKTYNERLSTLNILSIFAEYDIVVDGTDNFPAKYLINDGAIITKKPLVFGSIFKFEGQISVFNFDNGPTYRCLFPEPPGENALPNCSDIGVLGVLPGIIGGMMANEVLKMIVGIGVVLKGKLLRFDTLSMQQQILHFDKNINHEISRLDNDYGIFCGIKKTGTISSSDFKNNRNLYTLIDVRNYSEYQEFNIGGYHIPLHELESKASSITNTKPIVLCCQSGNRSKKAIQILTKLRKDLTLLNLEGGLNKFSL